MKRRLQCRVGMVLVFALLSLIAGPLPAVAGFDLKLSIVVGGEAGYVSPDGNKILITEQPTPFTVQVRNTSETSQQIFTDRISGVLSKLRFEMTDAQGIHKLVAQKQAFGTGHVWASRPLEPGGVRSVSVLLTPDVWDNVIQVPPGEVRRFTVRAVYENGSETLYSDRYEVTIAPPAMPGVMTAPAPAAPEAPPPITVVH